MSLVRRLAELGSRNRRIVRRSPKAFGARPLVVSPDASLRWLRRDPWRDEGALVQAVGRLIQPGTVTWDFGANVGAFAICAADRSRAPVVMVEADAFLAELLRDTARRNQDLALEVLCCAIGPAPGIARFAIAGRGRSTNGLVDGAISTQHGESREVRAVPTLAADDLLAHFPRPDLLKVDLEGAEWMFVEGAAKLLGEVRPALYIEIHRDNRPKVLGRLREAGYVIKQNLTGEWLEVTDDPPTEDFYAIPSERADSVFAGR